MTLVSDLDILFAGAEVCEADEPRAVEASWARGGEAGAEKARLREMVDAHFDAVYVALRRLGVPAAELDDCAQQVFVVASGKLGVIEPGREKAFLMGTAVHVASHAKRSQRRRREVPEGDEAAEARADAGPRPDEIVEQRRLRALLDEVLAAMPEDLRTVLVLFELEELTMQEISGALDLPMGTVASRLRRARELFARISARALGTQGRGRP
ncbi:RNA polymerase sigma factor [Polyangium jinanense]|uniref:Sigma-70 family RNA polymerase sigma factor n=1 Tax=Polyangium jinanense TaxID=2829994 RepID=A0A9X3XAT7_9BACT|nr:sigma-70 family RNA polymerase sigma factor [Polyangium jinanense]MDC3960636.1 sigma-70 family RNA polymerase sigma factor [Polyangium jinanense]MDC3986924.1 sigma-70 family RNA polymerase sigma factor [Polyangium jinanense]